jgi:hypothetical protein
MTHPRNIDFRIYVPLQFKIELLVNIDIHDLAAAFQSTSGQLSGPLTAANIVKGNA